jgi:hypothetical protein
MDCLEDWVQLLSCTHCAIAPVISHAVEGCAFHVDEYLLILRHLAECWLQSECHSFCNILMYWAAPTVSRLVTESTSLYLLVQQLPIS